MASKHAFRALAPRTCALLRPRSSAPRRPAPWTAPRQWQPAKPLGATGAAQQRWHSGFPQEQRSKAYQFEDIKQLVDNPRDTTLLIDVREPAEFAANSIPTALNIPVTSQPDALLLPADEFADRFGFEKPPLDKEVVFFCKAGVRSSAAAQLAKQGGYVNVGEYRGSWLDWERNGGVGTRSGPQ